jgi:succinylarginine dihydrolase
MPARQSLEASRAVAYHHGLRKEAVCFVQQHPSAVDAGAFHNDVVAVGHRHVHLFHEQAFVGGTETAARMAEAAARVTGQPLLSLAVPAAQVTLEDALRSYLFNSQLVTLNGGDMALVAPVDCWQVPRVEAFLDELVESRRSPIRQVVAVDLSESMNNGGGPACLRLRVVLTEAELASLAAGVLLTDDTLAALQAWVHRHYRDRLTLEELADPHLLDESRIALDELTCLLGLGTLYGFQRS